MTMTDTETWQTPSELTDQCRELYELACPPVWGLLRRPDFPTLGGRAARIMTDLGSPPMPWQRYILDVALEINPATGRFAYREVCLSVPRQQGKTAMLLAVIVHRCMAWGRQNVVYAAQTRGMARTRWEDEFLATLDASPLANRYLTRKTNGHEALIWKRGRSRFGITSNTEKAGHGPSLDLGLIDEAFAHEDARLEQAMSPAMLTKAMAQLWVASAGGTEKSIYLNDKRAAGRAAIERMWETGEYPSNAYFEWFAPDHLPRDKPSTWYSCMPALGHTVTEDVIRSELEKMKPADFDRAYLNRTKTSEPPPDLNVPKETWPGLADPSSVAGSHLAFAVDVAPLRDWASIGVASLRPDGRIHVELVDRRKGIDWVVPALVRLRDLWDPVATAVDVPSRSPAGSLLTELADAGFKVPEDPDKPRRGDLAVPRTGEVSAGCGQFADGMRQGELVHTDQLQLTRAVNGARTRPLGDAWAWSRRNAQVDISPLVAVTLARWALMTRGPLVQTTYDPVANVW